MNGLLLIDKLKNIADEWNRVNANESKLVKELHSLLSFDNYIGAVSVLNQIKLVRGDYFGKWEYCLTVIIPKPILDFLESLDRLTKQN